MEKRVEAYACLTDASIEKYYNDGAYDLYLIEEGEERYDLVPKDVVSVADLVDGTSHGFHIIAVRKNPTDFYYQIPDGIVDLVDDVEYEEY